MVARKLVSKPMSLADPGERTTTRGVSTEPGAASIRAAVTVWKNPRSRARSLLRCSPAMTRLTILRVTMAKPAPAGSAVRSEMTRHVPAASRPRSAATSSSRRESPGTGPSAGRRNPG